MASITQNRLRKTAVMLFFLTSALNAQSNRLHREMFLDNDGHKLHLSLWPLVTTGPTLPTLVFEGGLGGGAETWAGVIAQLPRSLRIVTYDRPGMGKSDPDGASPTPEHIASVLHAALSRVASPPYVLVGHSWGGPLIRAFAGIYPAEVAGLVFVDPSDFTDTALGRRRYVFGPLGHANDGEDIRSRIDQYFSKQAGEFPPAAQAEIDVSSKARDDDYASFSRLPMPSVPLVVLMSTQWSMDFPHDLTVPFDPVEYWRLLLNYRILSLGAFSHSVPEGTLVTTPNSGHYIQLDEPALVTWAIGRILYPSVERRLTEAFDHGGESSLEKEFVIVKRLYPRRQTSESALDNIGDTLLHREENRTAVALLRLNQREHPRSSHAFEALADAEAANGDDVSALRDYRASLRLNPKNQEVRQRISALVGKNK